MNEREFDEILLEVEAEWMKILAEFDAMWQGDRQWQEIEGLEPQQELDIPPNVAIPL